MSETTTADTGRINALEAQISDLDGQLKDVRHQLARAELDQWRGRIDDLEVQAHLGSLAVKDELDPLIDDLRNRWLDARERVTDGSDTANEVVDALRTGLEQAMAEIRRSVIAARSAAKR